MTKLSRYGGIAFVLWGLLHLVGGMTIDLAFLSGGSNAGYALYGFYGPELPAVTGAILGYFGFLISMSGLIVIYVAIRHNWRNSENGLAANTGVVLLIEVGLVLFLLVPGHVGLSEALPGLMLFIAGATLGGIACRREVTHVG